MVKICPQCNAENPVEAQFCGECGADLSAVTPGAPAATRNLGTEPGTTVALPSGLAMNTNPLPGLPAAPPPYGGATPPPPAYGGATPPPAPYGAPYTAAPGASGYPGAMAPTMGTPQWLMFGGGVFLALLSLLFLPICFGPLAIGLGAGVYASGGVQGKKLGTGLMIGAFVALIIGFGLGMMLGMASYNP